LGEGFDQQEKLLWEHGKALVKAVLALTGATDRGTMIIERSRNE